MDWLPHSVEGGITFFFSVLALVVGGVVRVTQAYRTAATKRMQSVPPSTPTHDLGRRLDTIERVLAEQRQWREEELQAELSRVLKELLEARQDADQLRQALATERLERQRLKRELEKRRAGR
jgi:SMC interacting uncharacterized protein involved in chromosome segregation